MLLSRYRTCIWHGQKSMMQTDDSFHVHGLQVLAFESQPYIVLLQRKIRRQVRSIFGDEASDSQEQLLRDLMVMKQREIVQRCLEHGADRYAAHCLAGLLYGYSTITVTAAACLNLPASAHH